MKIKIKMKTSRVKKTPIFKDAFVLLWVLPYLSSKCRCLWSYNINKDRYIAAVIAGFSGNGWHTGVMFWKSTWHLHFQRLLSKSGKIKDKAERKENECSTLIWESLQCLWPVSAERVWTTPLSWASNGDRVLFFVCLFLSLLGLLFFNNISTPFFVLYSIFTFTSIPR